MKFRKLVIAFVLLAISVFAPLYSVRAESGINENEAWIVAVINGVFEYDGHYYRAKDSYIAEATAYLNRDGVDLTADQAAKAVNYIYSHVADGIAAGYIYEIYFDDPTDDTSEDITEDITEDTTEDTTGTSSGKTEEVTTENPKKTTEDSTDKTEDPKKTTDKTDESGTTEASTEPGSTEAGKTEDGEATTGESPYGVDLPTDDHGAIVITTGADKTAYDDILSEVRLDELEESDKVNDKDIEDRPEEENADAKVKIDEETGDIIISSNDDTEEKRVVRYFPEWLVKTVLIIALAAFSITVLVSVFAALNKCFVLSSSKRRKYRKGHTRRKKIRKVSRWILTGCAVLEIIITALAGSLALVMFRKDTVMTNLNKGGYFRYEYTNYLVSAAADISSSTAEQAKNNKTTEETKTEAGTGTEADGLKEAINTENTVEILSYEEYLFKAKKEVSVTLSGQNTDDKILKVNAAKNVHDIRREFNNRLSLPVMIACIGLLMSLAAMYLLDGIRSRGVRYISMSLVIAGLIILMGGVIMYAAGLHTRIYAEPDYLYYFIREVILSMNRSVLITGIFMIAVGFMNLGLYRNIKKKENS